MTTKQFESAFIYLAFNAFRSHQQPNCRASCKIRSKPMLIIQNNRALLNYSESHLSSCSKRTQSKHSNIWTNQVVTETLWTNAAMAQEHVIIGATFDDLIVGTRTQKSTNSILFLFIFSQHLYTTHRYPTRFLKYYAVYYLNELNIKWPGDFTLLGKAVVLVVCCHAQQQPPPSQQTTVISQQQYQ